MVDGDALLHVTTTSMTARMWLFTVDGVGAALAG